MNSVPFLTVNAHYPVLSPLTANIPNHQDDVRINDLLDRELDTLILDNLHDHLWFVARPDFRNIDPMHRQLIKGREIFVTEDCGLHMVWDESRIFLKPIPSWLIGNDFGLEFLPNTSLDATPGRADITKIGNGNRARVLGFLRSYSYLVRHRSDFIIAQRSLLLPSDISWQNFEKFISSFRDVNNDVAPRYQYGQLRLSRLNWAVRIFRPAGAHNFWFYELPYWSTIPYLKAAAVPLAFAFAGVSLTLSSMQVMVGTPTGSLELASLNESGVRAMNRAYWFFSLLVIVVSGVLGLLFLGIPLCVVVWQISFGHAHRHR